MRWISRKPLVSDATTDEANVEALSGEPYLKAEVKRLSQWFDDESKKHKKLFRRTRYVVFALTACSSALAGLALAFPAIQTGTTIAVIITTAAIGVATSFEGLRKPQELWIRERTTHYALEDLKREMCYHADPALADVQLARLQTILGGSREKWSQDVGARNPAAVS